MKHNRLLAHSVKYNGLRFFGRINHTLKTQLLLKEFQFFEIPSTTGTAKYSMRHGEYVAPTENKNRRVNILFDIITDSPEERRATLRRVEKAFMPEYDPSPTNPNIRKKLNFMDIEGKSREMECQILKNIQISDSASEKRLTVSVELISKSSFIFSEELHTMSDVNHLVGFKLGTTIPFLMDQTSGIVNDFEGVIDVPLSATITTIADDPLPMGILTIFVRNKKKKTVLQLKDAGIVKGDIIDIDGSSRQVRKRSGPHKTNITGFLTLNSKRPSLIAGNNTAIVDAETADHHFDVERRWKDMF